MMDTLFPIGFVIEPCGKIRQYASRRLHPYRTGNKQHLIAYRIAGGHDLAVGINIIVLQRSLHMQDGHTLREAYAHYMPRRKVTLCGTYHRMTQDRILDTLQGDNIEFAPYRIEVCLLQECRQLGLREVKAFVAIGDIIFEGRTRRIGRSRAIAPDCGCHKACDRDDDADGASYYVRNFIQCTIYNLQVFNAFDICGTRRSMSPAPMVSTTTG